MMINGDKNQFIWFSCCFSQDEKLIFFDFFNSSYDLNAINNVSGFFYHGGIQLKPEKLKPASKLKSQPENDQWRWGVARRYEQFNK